MSGGFTRAIRGMLRDLEPSGRRVADSQFDKIRAQEQRELEDHEHERTLHRKDRERRLRRNWGL